MCALVCFSVPHENLVFHYKVHRYTNKCLVFCSLHAVFQDKTEIFNHLQLYMAMVKRFFLLRLAVWT